MVLGKQASAVFPAVIGAFQDLASKKAARELNSEFVDTAAMRARVSGMILGSDNPPDAEVRAIRALGMG